MKKIILSILCIFAFCLLSGTVSLASYTAPDSNVYEYKVYTSNGNYSTKYFSLYSDNKMCTVTGKENAGGLMIFGIFPDTNEGLVMTEIITKPNSIICSSGTNKYPANSLVSTVNTDYGYYAWQNNNANPSNSYVLSNYNCTNDSTNLPNFATMEEAYQYLTTGDVDYENLYYDPTIPTPNFNVSMIRPTPMDSVNSETNYFQVTWDDNPSYYIEIGYKYSVPNSMKVGLTDGNVVYTPLTYYNHDYINIYSLQDNHVAELLNSTVNSSDFVWSAIQITSQDDWATSVPIWANSWNAWQGKRDNWNNKYCYCMPLYGLKLEIFARLYYIDNGMVYVGAWKHWNNTYPNEYGEELPTNYQVGSTMPGYENTNNNTDYQDESYTITTIGTPTGTENTSTTIINNLTPNYPDYPTAVTYNHDNILLQMIDTTKRLPSFFGDFTDFCKECMTVIPSEIWEVIAFGFMCSILVMIVKVL